MTEQKPTYWKLIISLAVVAAILAVLAWVNRYYCSNQQFVWLLDETGQYLEQVAVELPAQADNQSLAKVLEMLYQGVEGYQPVIPEKAHYYDYKLEEGHLRLNFSEEFKQLAGISKLLCQTAIIKTMTGFDNVQSVTFLVNGIPFDYNRWGYQREGKDVYIEWQETFERTEKGVYNLYFVEKAEGRLVEQRREIVMVPYRKKEMVILERLMEGAGKATLATAIPAETEFLDVVTIDRICYLNVNAAFKNNYGTTGYGEDLVIYSIVNTLVDLPTIDQVQLLIEGEIEKGYQGGVSIEHPLKKNYSLVK